MLQHVVEREQAPEKNFHRSHSAVAYVLGAQGLVDLPAKDPAHLPVLQAVFGGNPLGDQGLDESKDLSAIHLEMEGKLRLGEEAAAMKTSQSDPFGFSSRPAQRLQCLLASLEMLNHAVTSTCQHAQASTAASIQPTASSPSATGRRKQPWEMRRWTALCPKPVWARPVGFGLHRRCAAPTSDCRSPADRILSARRRSRIRYIPSTAGTNCNISVYKFT